MKFKVEKVGMVNALRKCIRCSNQKDSLQSAFVCLTTNNKKNKLVMRKNNYYNEFSVVVSAHIEEAGQVVVGCKELLDIVLLMPDGTLSFDASKSAVHVKAGRTKMTLAVKEEVFINWPEETAIAEAVIPETVFRGLIGSVAYSAASTMTNPQLSSVKISIDDDKLSMVATDGHRLSESSVEIKPTGIKRDCLILAQQLLDISSLLSDTPGDDMSFVMTNNGYRIRMSDENVRISGRFIAGNYPVTAKKIISRKTENRITIDRKQLLEAMERCAYVSQKCRDLNNNRLVPVVLEIDRTVKLTVSTPKNTVSDEICCKIDGKPLRIGVNPEYFKDLLQKYPDENVLIGYESERSPLLVHTSSEEQTQVIMPVHIQPSS